VMNSQDNDTFSMAALKEVLLQAKSNPRKGTRKCSECGYEVYALPIHPSSPIATAVKKLKLDIDAQLTEMEELAVEVIGGAGVDCTSENGHKWEDT